jgi:YrbI family 3-deoxy-D-manno-octulosonate 8-phosphate phosphatase
VDNLVDEGSVFNPKIIDKARKIKLLLTDCDGVLTDGGVYYSDRGEELKRFSMRDGMGVERLRNEVGVEVGLITGERSELVKLRADKLGLTEVHMKIADKAETFREILLRRGFESHQVAYIGDDYNDLGVLKIAGLTACPADALPAVCARVDYVCLKPGGHGAFREFAELIIDCKR